jgi:hypothetical protein
MKKSVKQVFIFIGILIGSAYYFFVDHVFESYRDQNPEYEVVLVEEVIDDRTPSTPNDVINYLDEKTVYLDDDTQYFKEFNENKFYHILAFAFFFYGLADAMLGKTGRQPDGGLLDRLELKKIDPHKRAEIKILVNNFLIGFISSLPVSLILEIFLSI